jgi:hypothetical protein
MRRQTREVVAGITVAVLGTAAAIAASTPADAQVTTRIEPRPFYGATVSIEEGVRVFRPLPPHDRVIVNPGYAAVIELEGRDGGGLEYYAIPRNHRR